MTAENGQRAGSAKPLMLPPGFRAIALRELGDAFRQAQAVAPESGAGTLVSVGRFDSVELAIVLEPDLPLAEARRALYIVMNAFADALAGEVPPERPITFDWPDTIRLDGGIVGGMRLAWPQGTRDDAVPDWLVAGIVVRDRLQLVGKGEYPFDVAAELGTSLELAGLDLTDRGPLIENFCRYLVSAVHTFRECGFGPVEEAYLARLVELSSWRRSIAENGDLIEHTLDGTRVIERHSLAEALRSPRWRDPVTGEPWV